MTGDTDIATGDGLMVARILGAMAANESATKGRRVRRKMEQNAAAGLPHGGWRRPFGFHDDKVTIHADEAAVVRTLAARFIAGESLRSLAAWLEAEGVRTVSGNGWRTPTLSAMLSSGRIAGLREHRGTVVGKPCGSRSSPKTTDAPYSPGWRQARSLVAGPRSVTC